MPTENIAAPRPGEELRPLTYAECSKKFGRSIAWWRQQGASGAVKTVTFGAARAIPPSELARIAAEGLPPLPRYVPKGKVA
jgi:hypothetical protein